MKEYKPVHSFARISLPNIVLKEPRQAVVEYWLDTCLDFDDMLYHLTELHSRDLQILVWEESRYRSLVEQVLGKRYERGELT